MDWRAVREALEALAIALVLFALCGLALRYLVPIWVCWSGCIGASPQQFW